MNDPRLDHEKHRYAAIRERLLADDPDLDERTLLDTLEGVTDLHDMLAAATRAALNDEGVADMLKRRIAELTERRNHFEDRAERRRQKVRDIMLELDIKRIAPDDFTATLRQAPPKVVVIDETLIPPGFWEMRPHLLKAELLTALKDGLQLDGATLTTAGMSLSVRTK